MYHEPQTKQRGTCAAALCAMVLLVAGAAPAAETAARVTAVVGGANLGDAALDRSVPVGEDAPIETADDGNCAMLVDEDALVELCASTIMTLTRRPDTGQRVVKIDGGTTRIVVEPRLVGERIEIHTPAAIAIIMGTTVIVEVDRVTGETKFTADNPVRILSNDPSVTDSAVSSNMEQVTISPGEGPSQPKKIDRRALENLAACLVDLHGVAVALDRRTASARTRERMALGDGLDMTLPAVGLDQGVPDWEIDEPGGDDDQKLDPFDQCTDCSLPPRVIPVPPKPAPEIPGPEPCEGIPCDGGYPNPSPDQRREF
jgi:hypothetical protein